MYLLEEEEYNANTCDMEILIIMPGKVIVMAVSSQTKKT
jgi:hypothetical protein